MASRAARYRLRSTRRAAIGRGNYEPGAGAPSGCRLQHIGQRHVLFQPDSFRTRARIDARIDELLHYRDRAPGSTRAHPTDEHFLPFFVALGAATPGEAVERLHHSFTYGALGMDVYAFGALPT